MDVGCGVLTSQPRDDIECLEPAIASQGVEVLLKGKDGGKATGLRRRKNRGSYPLYEENKSPVIKCTLVTSRIDASSKHCRGLHKEHPTMSCT